MHTLQPRMRLFALGAAGLFLLSGLSLFGQVPAGQSGGTKGGVPAAQNAVKPPPPVIADPVAVTTKEGKTGWKVVIPGCRPLATPAVMGGKVLVGGGFGSYEFYAF